MVDSLFNYSLLSSLLIKDLEIPVILEKEFTIQCCIRGYHTYQSQWNASYVLIKTNIFLLRYDGKVSIKVNDQEGTQ